MNMRGASAASAASPPRRDRRQWPIPQRQATARRVCESNLAMRVMAALVLAPLAIAAAWFGGWFWLGLATITVIGLFGEWQMIVGNLRPIALMWGFLSLARGGRCARHRQLRTRQPVRRARTVRDVPVLGARRIARGRRSGSPIRRRRCLPACCCGAIRAHGFVALIFVFLVVWITDILGYFVGRGVGGPKLWVRVSPKKTWSGAIGGVVGSVAVCGGICGRRLRQTWRRCCCWEL